MKSHTAITNHEESPATKPEIENQKSRFLFNLMKTKLNFLSADAPYIECRRFLDGKPFPNDVAVCVRHGGYPGTGPAVLLISNNTRVLFDLIVSSFKNCGHFQAVRSTFGFFCSACPRFGGR